MPNKKVGINMSGERPGRETKHRTRLSKGFRMADDRYHSLFENVPIALLEEDLSSVKKHLDSLRDSGIDNLDEYLSNNPQELAGYVDMVKITDVNKAALTLFHVRKKDDLLAGLGQIFTIDTYDAFKEQLIALAGGETSFENERLVRTLDDEEKYVHLRLSVAPGFEDTWTRVLLSMTDITARKRAQEELKSNHEYLERLNNSLQEVIFRVRLPERTIAYVNHAVKNVFGYEEYECLGKTTEFLYPSNQGYQYFGQLLEQTMTEGKEALQTELSMSRKSGELFPAEITTTFLSEGGEITGVISILRDITRRRRAEDGLRLSEARLTEAQRIAHLGNWEWDIVNDKLLWSDEIYRIFGLTAQKSGVTYEAFISSVHPDDRELVENSVNDALYEAQPYDINHRIVLPDGTVRFVHERGEVTFSREGKPLRMIGTVHDITGIKRVEEELRTLSRSLVQIQEEERGSIARELHDEIGQSLTVLKLMLDRAKSLPPEDAESTLTEAATLVNGLMEQVRNLSLDLRPGMLDDLGLLPTLLWHFDNYTSKTQIKVNFKHSGLQVRFPSEISIAAYRIVQEALTNVVRHADVSEINVTAWVDRKMLWLRIEDKGIGFDSAAISPGISGGLFGMHERARSLEGELTIDSSPGAGTTIIARLPLSTDETGSKGKKI
jgi:PAS domain S-box-containing protein